MRKALGVIAVIAAVAIGITYMIVPAAAQGEQRNHASAGLEIADRNVHEGTGSGTTPETLSPQDVRFHQGLCQGGHETQAVRDILGSCANVPPPGN